MKKYCIRCNRRLPDNTQDLLCPDCKYKPVTTHRRITCQKCGKKLVLTGISDGVLCPACRALPKKSTINPRDYIK